MGRHPTRSDIPYAARLLMDKFNSIKEHCDGDCMFAALDEDGEAVKGVF